MSSLSSISAATASPTAATSSSTGQLSSTDFLKLLVAQFQNQDPSNPASSSDILNQTAALSEVQGINQLNTNLTSMLSAQQLTQSASLLGKTVSYNSTDAAGATTSASGVVSGVNLVNGAPQLTIGSSTVALSQVSGIQS